MFTVIIAALVRHMKVDKYSASPLMYNVHARTWTIIIHFEEVSIVCPSPNVEHTNKN